MNFFKKLFQTPEEKLIEKYRDNKLANKQFITHYFTVYIYKAEGESKKSFDERIENLGQELMDLGSGGMIPFIELRSEKSLSVKAVRENKDSYYFLVRFPDLMKEDFGKGFQIRQKLPGDKRSYEFSPILSLKSIKALRQIEFQYQAMLGLQEFPEMIDFKIEKGVPTVSHFDGIQEYSYPLKERLLLFKEAPDLEEKVFAIPAPEFLDWIFNKEGDNAHMKKYSSMVKKIIKDIGLDY